MTVQTPNITAPEFLAKFWTDADRNPQLMWDSWKAPHRHHVLTALRCIPDPKSLYELGCGSGPNLRLAAEYRPEMRLGGSEPNPTLADWARTKLHATVDEAWLPYASPHAWDVVLSCYALAYAEEPAVRHVLGAVRAKYLILVEPSPFVTPFVKTGLCQIGKDGVPLYIHDYLGLVRDTGWLLKWRWPIYPHYMGLNTVLIAERA